MFAALIQPDSGERHTLHDETTIGRSPENDITVGADGVSRFHAVIIDRAGGHAIRDLDSRNGTLVNGEPVGPAERQLVDGDMIVIASTATFRYLDPQATPAVPRVGKLQGVWIDPDTADVWVDARKIEPELSPRQYQLLCLLMDAAGKPVSRVDIARVVWSDVDPSGVSDDAVTALIKRLRMRLREVAINDYINIVRGRGVRLLEPGN
ncbi:MAG: FHA domain-containing protein [Actinomycetota bacterium]